MHPNKYFRSSEYAAWLLQVRPSLTQSLWTRIKWFLFDSKKYKEFNALQILVARGEQTRIEHNQAFVAKAIAEYKQFFDTIESNPLTLKQRESVVTDEDSTRIIAGAGTGKTSVLLAKIGFLLKKGDAKPEEILALSFTKKSAQELTDRIKSKLGVDLTASTFHRLGLQIIASANQKKPNLAKFVENPKTKQDHIQSIIESLLLKESFSRLFIPFQAYYSQQNRLCWEFNSLTEYRAWLSTCNKVSLKGIPMKSLEECHIANWLTLQGVDYEYEPKYIVNTATQENRQYCPDFYLPEYKIYIEHFGIKKNGDTAPFIDKVEYNRGIEWKRLTHKENKTDLLETYSWEFQECVVFQNLESKLKASNVKLNPIPDEKALELINQAGQFSLFCDLVGNFLTLFKGNGSKLVRSPHTAREKTFYQVFQIIAEQYQNINSKNEEIDFEDMILIANNIVSSSGFVSPWKYILIDEFQDISPGRAALVKSLQICRPGTGVFVVGDDWQSIYRFTGSDIASITQMENDFGAVATVYLDKTFRFDNKACAFSSSFISKNESQLKKNLTTNRSVNDASVVLYYLQPKEPPLDACLEQIHKRAKSGDSVLILERYNFHLPQSDEWTRLQNKFSKLKLEKMSVHASKGLESDYVIVGLRGGNFGFPSQLTDDPLMQLVLQQEESYPNAEERRLFYVAITRAKQRTYIVAESSGQCSVFTDELTNDKLKDESFPLLIVGKYAPVAKCAHCITGSMVLRDGANGKFYGCTNYPYCKYTVKTCSKCLEGYLKRTSPNILTCQLCAFTVPACPRCSNGILVKRTGKYGEFWGCTSYFDPQIKCSYKRRS